MLQDREVFEVYRGLLRQVVAARGGDANAAGQEYVWPPGANEEIPKAAASLSPLLTGGTSEPPGTQGSAPPGVASVPQGLAPPLHR
jgi:hypothetical protein